VRTREEIQFFGPTGTSGRGNLSLSQNSLSPHRAVSFGYYMGDDLHPSYAGVTFG
jgi:hypothetical protein